MPKVTLKLLHREPSYPWFRYAILVNGKNTGAIIDMYDEEDQIYIEWMGAPPDGPEERISLGPTVAKRALEELMRLHPNPMLYGSRYGKPSRRKHIINVDTRNRKLTAEYFTPEESLDV